MKHWELVLAAFIAVYFAFAQWVVPAPSPHAHLAKYLAVVEPSSDGVDYSQCAYVQYATDLVYLNLAILNFVAMRRSASAVPHMVVLYNQQLRAASGDPRDDGPYTRFDKLKILAANFGVRLRPVPLLAANVDDRRDDSGWSHSFTKLHVFNQVEFARVVYFDADSMVMNITGGPRNHAGNLDELFGIDADVALPRAYWLHHDRHDPRPRVGLRAEHKFDEPLDFFASHVMVVRPSAAVFKELLRYVYNPASWRVFHRKKLLQQGQFDMEVINKFIDNTLQRQVQQSIKGRRGATLKFGILPHSRYGVLSGEFRAQHHERLMAAPQDLAHVPPIKQSAATPAASSPPHWDAYAALEQIRLVHFSDAPVPKPWEAALDNTAYYNLERVYCGDAARGYTPAQFDRDFPVDLYKPLRVADCDSVEIWDWLRAEFERYRAGKWVA
ncbi:Glucose N-acetyltransferase 1 [[Candida] zeylanoides]